MGADDEFDGGHTGDDGPSSDRHVLVSGVTLGTFVVLGVFVAFAEWGVVPREVLVVGGPAIVVAILLDSLLYWELALELGPAMWLVVYAGLYLEAALFGFWMRWWRQAADRRRQVKIE
jgi:hypothetical protein